MQLRGGEGCIIGAWSASPCLPRVPSVWSGSAQRGGGIVDPAIAAGILLGLILKLTAIFPSLAAEQAAREQTWYEPTVAPLSIGRALIVRIGLSLASLALILAAINGPGPNYRFNSIPIRWQQSPS